MNIKTTAVGIGVLALAVGHFLTDLATGTSTMNTIWADIGGIVTGAGFVFAKDAGVH